MREKEGKGQRAMGGGGREKRGQERAPPRDGGRAALGTGRVAGHPGKEQCVGLTVSSGHQCQGIPAATLTQTTLYLGPPRSPWSGALTRHLWSNRLRVSADQPQECQHDRPAALAGTAQGHERGCSQVEGQGSRVGLAESHSGCSSGSHLHLEVRGWRPGPHQHCTGDTCMPFPCGLGQMQAKGPQGAGTEAAGGEPSQSCQPSRHVTGHPPLHPQG